MNKNIAGVVTQPFAKNIDVARAALGETALKKADSMLKGTNLNLAPAKIDNSYVTQSLSESHKVRTPLANDSYNEANKLLKGVNIDLTPLEKDTFGVTQSFAKPNAGQVAKNLPAASYETADEVLKKSKLGLLEKDTFYVTQPISRPPVEKIEQNLSSASYDKADSILKNSELSLAELEPVKKAPVAISGSMVSKAVKKEPIGLLKSIAKLLGFVK